MPWGIGDTITVGLSAVDQITRNDPDGKVKIDVLCNSLQAELLEHDPRIHRLVQVDSSLFPSSEAGSWKRGIVLPVATRKLAAALSTQHYTAVLPFVFSLSFIFRPYHSSTDYGCYRELFVVGRFLRLFIVFHSRLPSPQCQGNTRKTLHIYTHIYPRWDIAFARVFDYTDTQEEMLISAPQTRVSIGCGHV
jgi:hypothetical protein